MAQRRFGNLLGWAIAGFASMVTARGLSRHRTAPELDVRPEEGPKETWRGSGLAEDVGAPVHGDAPGPNEKERRRLVRRAEHELGLPHRA